MSDSGSEYSGSGEEKSHSESEDSEIDETPSGKKRGRRKNSTSFTCHHCRNQFPRFYILKNHMKNCKKRNWLNKCMWCGLQFTNRGNLASHAYHIHGDSSYKSLSRAPRNEAMECNVCNKSFVNMTNLRYHIRKTHFNLKAKIPHAEIKKVNQIWFEKVLNSDKIVEIKKTGHSSLILKTLEQGSGIRVKDVQHKVVDLTPLYPLGKNARVICDHCNKEYLKRDLRKHIEERHLNIKKFACNNCQRTFKRSYQYLQHQCGRIRRTKGVRHVVGPYATSIKISSVEGFAVPL